MEKNKENNIEFLTGDTGCVFTFTDRTMITKMKKLYDTRPNDFEYVIENNDGSICGRVPKSWARKFGPPATRNLSDEQRAAMSERMKNMRDK